jgi:hypothetical protein
MKSSISKISVLSLVILSIAAGHEALATRVYGVAPAFIPELTKKNRNAPDPQDASIACPWSNTPTSSSGTFLGQATINDTPATASDCIAAFDEDGNVAGVATLIEDSGNAFINLVIYGDDTTTPDVDEGMNGSETFTLKLYDASADEILDCECGPFSGWVNTNAAPMPGFDDPFVIYNFVGNMPPSSTNDSATTDEDMSVDIDVLGNDSDPDGDALSVSAIPTPPTHGSAVINGDDTVTYTPDADYNGTDSFTYTVSDGSLTDEATVSITINPVNDAPTATDDSATTNEDVSVDINVLGNDSDIDGDALSVSAIPTPPTHGSAVINGDDTVTYTPDADYNGTDSFTYTVSDGSLTDEATVSITINPVNDAPAFTSTPVTSAQIGKTYNYTATTSDVDGDAVTLTAPTLPAWLTFTDHGDGTGTLSGTPDSTDIGAHDVTLAIDDGNEETAEQSFTITVSTNTDPSATNDSAITDEDTPAIIDVLDNDSDPDGDTLEVTSVSDPDHGSASINGNDTITYTPDANYNGPDSFTYTISDGSGGTDSATVTVTVTAVNDAPTAVNDTTSVNEDAPIAINVIANDTDVDGDDLSVSIVTAPPNGTAVNNHNGTITYTPDADYNGPDNFTYTLSDGSLTDEATVSITVNPVNDAPAFTSIPVTSAREGEAYSYTATTKEVDGDALTLTAPILPTWMNFTDHGDGTGTLSGTPGSMDGGTHDVTLKADDGNGGTAEQSFTVTVSINLAPSATNDTTATNEDTLVEIDVLANDSDPDGDALTIISVTTPENGTADIIDSDARIRYTPVTDFFGEDSFTYTVEDGNGGTDTATVTVTVKAVNDPPEFLDSPVFISPTDGSSIIVGGNDGQDPVAPDALLKVEWKPATDPDGDETSYTWQLSGVEDFSVMLLPNADFDTNAGTSTFFEVDYGTLAGLLTNNGVDLFGSVTLFHRVVASDGQAQTISNSASITLTRGAIVNTENDEELPEAYMLLGNYPNPFNPVTTFRFALPQPDHLRISVYDILGRQVATLVDGVYPAGWHSVRWDASGFVSGLYFVHMTGSGFISSQTATLLK